MRHSRTCGVLVSLLVGTLPLATAGCSPLGNSWTAADLEQAIEAITTEASTDQLVSAREHNGAVAFTLLTESGAPEQLLWDFRDREVVRGSGAEESVGPPDPETTAASAVPLSTLDPHLVVERNPCDRRNFTFRFAALGMDGTHHHLVTRCFDLGEGGGEEINSHLDGQPLETPSLTDPDALARLTEEAEEYTGQSPTVASVQLRHAADDGMRFLYTAGTATHANLVGASCLMGYERNTSRPGWPDSAIQTPCVDAENSYRGSLTPFATSHFDPEVMVKLWNREVAQRSSDDDPYLTLIKASDGGPAYHVIVDAQPVKSFDPEGNPLP